MKKSIAVLLTVCFLTMEFSGIALAAVGPAPDSAYAKTSHHSSFWVHTGKYIAGAAVIWWIVDGLSHKKDKNKDKDKDKNKVIIIELKPDTVTITPIP